MLHFIVIALLLAGLLVVGRRSLSPGVAIRAFSGGLLALNIVVAVVALGGALLLALDTPTPVQAETLQQEGQAPAQQQEGGTSQIATIGAALATGLAAIGAGIAVGIAGAAAIGTITEKPEVLGRTLIFVGLAEGIAIYGLIISFLILTGGLGGG
jgi:V/A-type H+-transporting ATPase subunit K